LTRWVEVTTADLDSMLAVTPEARHQQNYVLPHTRRRWSDWRTDAGRLSRLCEM